MTDQQPSTLQRLPNWRLHFDQLLCSRLQTNFAWGIFDCCLFAADVVQAVTGIDPAAPYRGYRGARQGMRLLRRAGGVGAFAIRALGFPVRMDLENLIIEGARQLREWEQLQEEIPSLDMALKFMDRPGTNLRNINLSVEEWRVVSYVNPKNTMRQIAQATKMNDLEIRRVIYGLLQAGLVEIVRPGGATLTNQRMFPTTNKEEQKSLVNRLINRIRSI